MKCTTCGWEMLPPTCQNPDCKRGNKKARPKFKPPLRTQRGHGPNPRVRAYQASADVTLDDPVEQGRDAGWDNWHTERHRKIWEGLTPAERARVEAEARGEVTDLMHLKVGDSATTMRATCGLGLRDRCWTQNPNLVSCPRCLTRMMVNRHYRQA